MDPDYNFDDDMGHLANDFSGRLSLSDEETCDVGGDACFIDVDNDGDGGGFGTDNDLFETLMEEFLGDDGFDGEDVTELDLDLNCFAESTEDVVDTRSDLALLSGENIYDYGESDFLSMLVDDCTKEALHEEISFPVTKPIPAGVGQEAVPITRLTEITRSAFKGTEKLNRIQSIVFEAAYHSDENLLICAPTGAGKTNIAMLSILHEVNKNVHSGRIRIDAFKIVYVAPMKALAAEMVRTFGSRLMSMGITVRELTGDMQLSREEIMRTQMLVTTPEKWDVVTRKTTGNVALVQLVKLLIIDEVHLLHDERGAVIESLVARTLRQVESYQRNIRIVGLSATLPNYHDVARFLHVDVSKGLFFFDGRFRPVPLRQTFIGVKRPLGGGGRSFNEQRVRMDMICYKKVRKLVEAGHQVMVFVFARKATEQSATDIRDRAIMDRDLHLFLPANTTKYSAALSEVMNSPNKQLRKLFPDGFAIHHAGMLRQDRNLVERHFADGIIKVLCCTSTLAWGVNLPAHAVIIKGTQFYNPDKSAFVDIGMLDVLQIFGRAGRPQYDTFGEAFIITAHEKLDHYVSLMRRQNPIESQFLKKLEDNLNAEIVLGTVSNLDEAVRWLSYTYLYVRMLINPSAYGVVSMNDPDLARFRRSLIEKAVLTLRRTGMIKVDDKTGAIEYTELGRIASHFYIKRATIEMFNSSMKKRMTHEDILDIVSSSAEFKNVKIRREEQVEIGEHHENDCMVHVPDKASSKGKVNVLLQTHISRGTITLFSLVSDSLYVTQNSTRIMRALFEVVLFEGRLQFAENTLTLIKSVDQRIWPEKNALRQIDSWECDQFLDSYGERIGIPDLKVMAPETIGQLAYKKEDSVGFGKRVQRFAHQLPFIRLDAVLQPLTRTLLRIHLTVTPDFTWSDRLHGSAAQHWWIWVEDRAKDRILHYKFFSMSKHQVEEKIPQELLFNVPIVEYQLGEYNIKAVSETWLGTETNCPVSLKKLVLPKERKYYTDLDLEEATPSNAVISCNMPLFALQNARVQMFYQSDEFNSLQTAVLNQVYMSKDNVLLGAPGGAGKLVAAELAMMKVLDEEPNSKIVYITPSKALVRRRLDQWKIKFGEILGERVFPLNGDTSIDVDILRRANIIVTTPEKWDAVSRRWQNVQAFSLLIIDRLQFLGDDGGLLDLIVSRTKIMSQRKGQKVRMLCLSTTMANPREVADWMDVDDKHLFNFQLSQRPVPLEISVIGFSGRTFQNCAAAMNKPIFQAIKTTSEKKPVLVFVSSKKQTTATAFELIAFLRTEKDSKLWLKLTGEEVKDVCGSIADENLRLAVSFGIGMHHPGLSRDDRRVIEQLYRDQHIQVLIATKSLAWSTDLRARLVVIKGTEQFDFKTQRYIDTPVTDLIQMISRAGRIREDSQGTAVVLVPNTKKHYYDKVLRESMTLESEKFDRFADHLNVAVAEGIVATEQDAADYVGKTFLFKRLSTNPRYYGLELYGMYGVHKFVSDMIRASVDELTNSSCIQISQQDTGKSIHLLPLGRIASEKCICHETIKMFHDVVIPGSEVDDILHILSSSKEFDVVHVRQDEEAKTRYDWSRVRYPMSAQLADYKSSHAMTNYCIQAHISRLTFSGSDYTRDTRIILDKAVRLLTAMVEVVALSQSLDVVLRIMRLAQSVVQARWEDESSLLTLPHVTRTHLSSFTLKGLEKDVAIDSLKELVRVCDGEIEVLQVILEAALERSQIQSIWDVLEVLPGVEVEVTKIRGRFPSRSRRESRTLQRVSDESGKTYNSSEVLAMEKYHLHIELRNRNEKGKRKAHAPLYPRLKEVGWWVVLGDRRTNQLLSWKKVGNVFARTSINLSLTSAPNSGPMDCMLFLISDSYLGLDTEFNIRLEVKRPDYVDDEEQPADIPTTYTAN